MTIVLLVIILMYLSPPFGRVVGSGIELMMGLCWLVWRAAVHLLRWTAIAVAGIALIAAFIHLGELLR